jgi:hypothetical protein
MESLSATKAWQLDIHKDWITCSLCSNLSCVVSQLESSFSMTQVEFTYIFIKIE